MNVAEGNRVKAKEETPYAVYLDLSGSSTAEALASKGIYAYAYDDAEEAETAEPVKLEKVSQSWQMKSVSFQSRRRMLLQILQRSSRN